MHIPHKKRTTKVVNIYESSYDVYVGSTQSGTDPRKIPPGQYGFLANPFQDSCDQDESLELFREYFLERVGSDRRFRLAVISVWGKRLGCFCVDGEICHADIIAEWLETQRQAHHQLLGPPQRRR